MAAPITNLSIVATDVLHPFDVPENPHHCEKVVIKAMTKFCSEEEIKAVKTKYRRSTMDINALMQDIYNMNIADFTPKLDSHFESALDYVESRMFPSRQLFRPVKLSDMKLYPWKKNASACEPFYTSEHYSRLLKEKQTQGIIPNSRCTFGNLYDEIFEETDRIQQDIAKFGSTIYPKYTYDILAFARAHIVEEDEPDKIRFVYGCPKPTVITEAQFLWPMFAVMKQFPQQCIMAWGYETLTGGIAKLNKEIGVPKDSMILAIDWKSFDKRVHFDIIKRVYERIDRHIDFQNGYVPTPDIPDYTDQQREELETLLRRTWDWTKFCNMHAPIRAPTGERFKRNFAGIPSGLFATNYLDSWVNATCLTAVLFSLGLKPNDILFMKVMGDDSLINISTPEWHFKYDQLKEKIIYTARDKFNFVVSEKKSSFTSHLEGTKFLGFTSVSSMPFKETTELLANLAHPERSTSFEILSARCIGIAYASCMADPRVYLVCKDVYEFLTSALKIQPNAAYVADHMEAIGFEHTDATVFPTPQEITKKLLNATHKIDRDDISYYSIKRFLDY